MDAKRQERLLKNCHPMWGKQFQSGGDQKVWAKLTPQVIIDLLDNCAFGAKYQARQVLAHMEDERQNWQLRATAHVGGKEGSDRANDMNLHITINAGGISYHLRCKEQPQLHVIQITR
jgi:hypothetical protein